MLTLARGWLTQGLLLIHLLLTRMESFGIPTPTFVEGTTLTICFGGEEEVEDEEVGRGTGADRDISCWHSSRCKKTAIFGRCCSTVSSRYRTVKPLCTRTTSPCIGFDDCPAVGFTNTVSPTLIVVRSRFDANMTPAGCTTPTAFKGLGFVDE